MTTVLPVGIPWAVAIAARTEPIDLNQSTNPRDNVVMERSACVGELES
ncbi:hypothetical protein MITS9509_00861 [Synechococcus sp. MIT S9509]|nr:hypothetical protein MITS9504_01003 [Synechococcus sp. MIT S9504]KZR92988.1 hypothetical protein MITS9509_00861 [Synechococcus sp. MIT S9509]